MREWCINATGCSDMILVVLYITTYSYCKGPRFHFLTFYKSVSKAREAVTDEAHAISVWIT
jgi:hypothetical protein